MSPLRSFVQVTGLRQGRFVEFTFTLGDEDLSVDLILPRAAFDAFCAERGAIRLPPAPRVDVPGAPGLYHPPPTADP